MIFEVPSNQKFIKKLPKKDVKNYGRKKNTKKLLRARILVLLARVQRLGWLQSAQRATQDNPKSSAQLEKWHLFVLLGALGHSLALFKHFFNFWSISHRCWSTFGMISFRFYFDFASITFHLVFGSPNTSNAHRHLKIVTKCEVKRNEVTWSKMRWTEMMPSGCSKKLQICVRGWLV